MWIVRRNFHEQQRSIAEQIAVQSAALTGPGDFAGPDVQTVVLLAVDAEPFKVLLYPCPFGLLFLFREASHLWMFLRITLKNPRTYEKDGPCDRMQECFRIVDDQAARLDAVSQPRDEMVSGWCCPAD